MDKALAMATLGRVGSVKSGPVASIEPSTPVSKLWKAWEITKILYKNDFTRYCPKHYPIIIPLWSVCNSLVTVEALREIF